MLKKSPKKLEKIDHEVDLLVVFLSCEIGVLPWILIRMIEDQGGALYLKKCVGMRIIQRGWCVNKMWWDKNSGSIKQAFLILPTLDKELDFQLLYLGSSFGGLKCDLEKKIVDLGGEVYMRKKVSGKKYQHVVMCVGALWWKKNSKKVVTT